MCSCSRMSGILFTAVQSFQNPIVRQFFCCLLPHAFLLVCTTGRQHLSNDQLSSSPSGDNFSTCCYAVVYTEPVSPYTTLIPKFCQATRAKMFIYIGFVNSYTAVTTNGYIFN